MKLLIDFTPIKSGGGAQLAINFLKLFRADYDYDVIVSDAFPFDLDKLNQPCNVIVTSSNMKQRFLFEYFNYKKLLAQKGYTHVYTFFGAGLPKVKGIKQITGVAYPIICNDDSPYWRFIPLKYKVHKKILNHFRKSRLKTADHIIFETEVMQRRCCNVLKFNSNKTTVLAPTPSSFIKPSKTNTNRTVVKFLILSGLDYHKNIWRLVQLLPRLKKENVILKFVLSSTLESLLLAYKHLIKEVDEGLISEYFEFIGHIQADRIQNIYDDIDIVLNIADLESFSNNYMEAWVSRKPILASDRDFAKHICQNSAIYVEPHDQESLLNGLITFTEKRTDIENLKLEGDKMLSYLPRFEQRVEKIIEVIIS